MLNIKMDAKAYTAELKAEMSQTLQHLHKSLPENPKVSILAKRNGWIKISPFEALPDPENLAFLKEEIKRRCPMTSLVNLPQAARLLVVPHEAGLDTPSLQMKNF